MVLDELTMIMHKVPSFGFLTPLIPIALRRLIIPVDSSSSQQKRESSNDSPDFCKKKTVRKKRISAWWAKWTGKNFSAFSAHRAQAPSISGVPVCLKYHILGSCSSQPRMGRISQTSIAQICS